ncbi:MAG TPA: FkbM family methyltransferase [Candidatus Acidoferrales bacterium]|nr:FkbM family methyltransferase [Candidatus Acidoferrales bacterium]
MGTPRNRLAELLLRSPIRFRSLQGMPVVGEWFHRLSHHLLPSSELVWTRVRNGPAKGMWLELNPRTGHDYAEGRAEASVQQAVADYLKPGMVFYDLGANIGLFSLLASQLVGETGSVFSFEPDPATVTRLRRNIDKNCVSNITIVEAGVGSTTGKFAFLCANSSSPDRGVGRFTAPSEECHTEDLQCYALDDFVLESPCPDAVKCDVEGAEVEVIRGARKLLASRRPWIIFEIHSVVNGDEVRDLCSHLGYKARAIDENHLLAEP